MDKLNIPMLRNALAAAGNKKIIGEFINDQKMIDEVRTIKARIIAEVCKHDPVIRARFNDLLCQL